MATRTITPEQARAFLVGHHGLRQITPCASPEDAAALLADMRCIQLDPIDRVGTNVDLVAMARLDGLTRGAFHQLVLPAMAFEHFAKERCLLPPSAFPYYRERAVQTPWWRHTERMKRLPDGILADVLTELAERGPSTASDLEDRGTIKPLDWNGWTSTTRATTMALEVLWTRCQVVVCGRTPRGKLYDLPARALPEVATRAPDAPFDRWALLERVEAAGLLARASGPHWSVLHEVRTGGLPDDLIKEGLLEPVQIRGSRREYLAPTGFLDRAHDEDDGRMRILAPLDPLIWDRKLIAHAFGFDYVWEVYKPADARRWGYYVCPLLHRGHLVGRFEGHVEGGELVCDGLWKEESAAFDEAAWREAFERHAGQV